MSKNYCNLCNHIKEPIPEIKDSSPCLGFVFSKLILFSGLVLCGFQMEGKEVKLRGRHNSRAPALCTVCCVFCALRIVHYALCIVYCVLCTVHCVQPRNGCIQIYLRHNSLSVGRYKACVNWINVNDKIARQKDFWTLRCKKSCKWSCCPKTSFGRHF